jgi:hypothetical protein
MATKKNTRKQSKTKSAPVKTSKAKSPRAVSSSTLKRSRPRAASDSAAAPAPRRFRVQLEKHAASSAAMLTVPFDTQKFFGTRGQVPVRCTVNGFPFRGTIFPKGDGTHYMVLNREVRAGAGVEGGQTVSMTLERDTEPRVITPPAELARALKSDKAARAAWDKLSYTHQKEHARAVEDAKLPETRRRRVERAIAELAAGKKPA